ncbi:MAG: DNA mismatch repair protein MutS [Aerococcus sp.]|nr:DNA mismatch repair protein MutS [Aerococcus sp.]
MAKNNITPMMEQYQTLKEKYPDAFLFFRLGDFYEMFNEDAIKAAKLLEITLTSRNKNSENPVPMCGVPHHAVSEYVKTLVDQGYKVAIAEQMQDPKLTKGMVERDVIRVITPGTYIHEGGQQTENNYLVAIEPVDQQFTLAYADISTGELQVTTVANAEVLKTEFSQLRPKEIVVEEWLPDDLEDALHQITPFISSVHQENMSGDQAQQSEQLLVDIDDETERHVLKLLLSYTYATQLQLVGHWQHAVHYEVDHYLQMDYFAKRNLELTTSIRTNQRSGGLLHFIDRTETAMGGRLLKRWLERPLIVKSEINQRLDAIGSLIDHFFERETIAEKLRGVYDLERLVAKVSMHSVNARDLLQLKHSLEQIPQIIASLEDVDAEVWKPITSKMQALPEMVDLIGRAINPDAGTSVTEGNVINSGFDEQLDQYRNTMTHGHEWLAQLQANEREATGIKNLKIGYNKVFGYYIEVSKSNLQYLSEGKYERKQTLANAERFITPELKEMEQKILEAEEHAEQLEYQLFVKVRDQVNTYKQPLQVLAQAIAAVDVLQGLAQVSEDQQFVRPTFADDYQTLRIVASRHPVVEETIGREAFVPNDFEMDKETHILLITGPNMSGKSTYMRQLGLTVVMAQMGCFVPAESAELPIFDKIFTRIGASDDLQAGQSTFMVEMMEANQALKNATDHSLLLFDEIGRGTSTYDGIALAQAILEYIDQHIQAKVLFSTHYHELTGLEATLPGLTNVHVGATEENGDVVFLHRVLPGAADKSYGIHVAKLAGMPKSLLDNAQHILEQLESGEHSQDAIQQSLFSMVNEDKPDTTQSDIIDAIDALDLDDTTPRKAWKKIEAWQQQLKGE